MRILLSTFLTGSLLVFTACTNGKPEAPKDVKTSEADKGAKEQGKEKSAMVQLKDLDEKEPNNKTSEATEVTESSRIKANLEPASGEKFRAADWYKVVCKSRKKLSFELSPIPEQNIRLRFLDGDKNKLFYVDTGKKGEGEVFPNLVAEGAVYVKVEGEKGAKGGPYTLSISFSDVEDGFETEFNGRYSTADEIRLGTPVKGLLSNDRDEDWYLLSLADVQTGAVLRIDLTSVPGVKFHLIISDEQERRPVLETDSLKKGEGIVIRNLGIPSDAKGLYITLKSAWVHGDRAKKYVRTSNAKEPYTLSVSAEAGGDDLEKEPDDDAEHAFAVMDGQKVRAYLARPNDVDWFKIQVERPSILSAELSALNKVDLQLYVIDPEKKDQKRNYELVRINQGKVNEPEILTNCALAPGENYVKVTGAWKKVDGKWIQDYSNLDETYSLTLNLRTDDGREEREPDNSVDKATPIKVGQSLRGTMYPSNDADFFLLDLSSMDGPHNTTIECTGIPKVDIRLELLGPEMDDKDKHKVIASSNKGKGEAKEQITKELMPGQYWIVVRGPKFYDPNSSDQYLLTVTQ